MDSFDIFLYIAYTMVIVAAAAAIIIPFVNAISNPKAIVKGAMGVAFIGVFFLIAYAISGSEVTAAYAKYNVGPELSKSVGAVLILAYMLLGISVIGIFLTEINKIFK